MYCQTSSPVGGDESYDQLSVWISHLRSASLQFPLITIELLLPLSGAVPLLTDAGGLQLFVE